MDETRLDPQTPAHIFAYRAFRSVFVGSPESSPIKPTYDENNDSPKRPSRFTTSPTHAKRGIESQPILTPKRQKTLLVSPSKSILRNKNTPRRQGLKDATVTFKNVSANSSPKSKRLVGQSFEQPKFGLANAPSFEVVDKLQHVVKDNNPVMVNVDLQAYKQQTEKEMKRLMKYATKWKDQAKKHEVEVQRLQRQVETLQKSNDRLTDTVNEIELERDNILRKSKQHRSSSISPVDVSTRSKTELNAKRQERSVYPSPSLRPDTNNRQNRLQQRDLSAISEVSAVRRDESRAAPASQKASRSIQPSLQKSQIQQSNLDTLPDLATIRPDDSKHVNRFDSSNHEQPTSPRRTVSLPVRSVRDNVADKKAAIRARLAAKNAARKADTSSIPARGHQRNSSKAEDESQFDCADV